MAMQLMAAARGIKRSWRRLAVGCGLAAVAGAAFFWGRTTGICQTASAQPATQTKPGAMVPEAPLAPESGTDYSRRVVAYIYKNIPVTREDLGEYLIARYGAEKIDALINRRLVDIACQAKGIHITDAEVNATLAEDLKGFGGISLSDFENKLLKPRHSSVYQWREDVIRPKLALSQFCRDRVRVTDWDVTKAYENRYGPKVLCRMILIPKDQGKRNTDVWTRIRNDEKAFDQEARRQSNPTLAARGGEIPPICKYCGDDRIEKEAFNLNPGEVGSVIETPDGSIILKCVKHIDRDESKKLDKTMRETLEKEIFERKIMEEIPKVLKEMRAKAEPLVFFKKPVPYEQAMTQIANEAGIKPATPSKPTPAHAN
jgi:PPIC-type PPIASE domain